MPHQHENLLIVIFSCISVPHTYLRRIPKQ